MQSNAYSCQKFCKTYSELMLLSCCRCLYRLSEQRMQKNDTWPLQGLCNIYTGFMQFITNIVRNYANFVEYIYVYAVIIYIYISSICARAIAIVHNITKMLCQIHKKSACKNHPCWCRLYAICADIQNLCQFAKLMLVIQKKCWIYTKGPIFM